jgi:MFS family permease
VRAYLEVLADRRARSPILAAAVSRLTPGMIGIGLVLAVREAGYGYAAAGLVAGAHQLGVGVGSPFQGRLADRLGHARVLVPDAVLYLAGTIAIVVGSSLGWAVPALTALALVTGAVQPPTTPVSRALLGSLFTTGRLRETVFAVNSIAVELGFIVGPLAVVVISAAVGARWAVLGAGLFAAAGAIGYARTEAVRTAVLVPRATGRAGALESVGLRVMVVAYVAIAASFGTFDLVAAAVAERSGVPSAAGTLISIIAFGSLIGGLVYGARVWPGTPLVRMRVMVVVFALGLAVVPFVLGRLGLLGGVLLVVGASIGPMNISAFQLIDDLSPPSARAEAQSWTQASVFLGSAAGAAMGGVLIDVAGPAVAMGAGAGAVGVAAVILNVGRRLLVPPERSLGVSAPAR